MPMVSKAQRGAMYAAKAGKSTLGIPKSVGEKFVKHDTGGKLPDYATPKANRRDYPKGYAGGGGVTIEKMGHPLGQEISSSFSSGPQEMDEFGRPKIPPGSQGTTGVKNW